MHHSSRNKLNSNPEIYGAEKALGGMGGQIRKRTGMTHNGAFSKEGADFIPYEYPKDNELQQHFALIRNTALTAAPAGSGIMFDSPLRMVNSVSDPVFALAKAQHYTPVCVCV